MNREIPFLFASDLDGTLLPNTGKLPDLGCLERTWDLLLALHEAGCPVCYVTGRHLFLARQGASVFRLPLPTWWVCNVGTEIYERNGRPDSAWRQRLGPPLNQVALKAVLCTIPHLVQQEAPKQGPHKLSFYFPEPASWDLQQEILGRLRPVAEDLQLVASVEDISGRGLLDIIPAGAGKAQAVRYLAERCRKSATQVFFAGDSGNDLDVLLSGVNGTLVGNATPEVVQEVRRLQALREGARVFVAGAYYGDGILEGLAHYGLWPMGMDGQRDGRPDPPAAIGGFEPDLFPALRKN